MGTVIYSERGKHALAKLWYEYIDVTEKYKLPFILTTPTRKVNIDTIKESDYNESIIFDNVSYLKSIKDESKTHMYVGGLMGCRGDACKADNVLSAIEGKKFHTG